MSWKYLKNIPRSFLVIGLPSLVFFLGTLLLVRGVPALSLSDWTLRAAKSILKTQGVYLNWETLQLTNTSAGWFQRQFRIRGKNVCYFQEGSYCFESVDSTLTITLRGPQPLVSFSEIRLLGGKVRLNRTGSTRTRWLTAKLRRSLQSARVEHAEIDIAVFSDGKWINGSAQVLTQPQANSSGTKATLRAKLLLQNSPSLKPLNVDVEFWAADGEFRSFETTFVKLNAELSDANTLTADFSLASQRTQNQPLSWTGNVSVQGKEETLAAQILASGNWSDLSGTLTGRLINLHPNIPSISFPQCPFKFTQASSSSAKFSTDCDIHLQGRFDRIRSEGIELARRIAWRFNGEVSYQGPDGLFAGEVKTFFTLSAGENTKSPPIQISGNATISDPFGQKSLVTEITTSIPKFQKWVELTHNTPWAIPGPFNALEGSIEVHTSGGGKLTDFLSAKSPGLEFPIEFKSRLKSERQVLNMDGSGVGKITHTVKNIQNNLNLDLVFSDVSLLLPEVGLRAPAKVIPDQRIHHHLGLAIPKAKSISFLKYAVRVRTPTGKPLQLLSGKSTEPTSVTLALVATNQGVGGYAQVLSAPKKDRPASSLEVLKLNVGNSSLARSENYLQVLYTDEATRNLVLGLLGHSQLKFLGHTPLPQSEVISQLLYGKPIDKLDANQIASVNLTRIAVNDGAVDVTSLLNLPANTVDGVAFDKGSGVLDTKVKLNDDTLVNLKTNIEQIHELGIRARLDPNWTIVTRVNNPLAPPQRSLTAFLEWSMGY
jgi:hypothetical protein